MNLYTWPNEGVGFMTQTEKGIVAIARVIGFEHLSKVHKAVAIFSFLQLQPLDI